MLLNIEFNITFDSKQNLKNFSNVTDEMIRMLKEEFSQEKIDQSYDKCCNDDLVKVSPEVERITQAIDDLCDMVSKDLVFNCKKLEKGFKEKCDEIKR